MVLCEANKTSDLLHLSLCLYVGVFAGPSTLYFAFDFRLARQSMDVEINIIVVQSKDCTTQLREWEGLVRVA